MVLPVAARPVAHPAAPEVVSRSVFVVPTNPKDGRDPFFPNSTRSYEIVSAARPHAGDVSSLVLKGISGPPERRLAIINNHTFGVGDEQDLAIPHGRIQIGRASCRERGEISGVAGQRHELKYATR